MAQTLVIFRTGETKTIDIPDSSTTTSAVARGDATHVDSAPAAAHVDSAPALPAAQISAPASSGGGALTLAAATVAPMSSSIQSSSPVVSITPSDSHTDSGSDAVVGRSASFELPFTHEVASGSDVTYVTQDDGSIVVADVDTGLSTDWTIIV